MGKIKDLITKIRSWVRTDGLLHIETSLILMMVCGVYFSWFVSAEIVAVIGLAKEIYDLVSGKGTPEAHDLWCDLIGIALGAGLLLFYAI